MTESLKDVALLVSLATNVFLLWLVGKQARRSTSTTAPESGARPSAPAASISDADRARIRDLLRTDGKIQAIKLYRELTGSGLLEAKNAVEALETR